MKLSNKIVATLIAAIIATTIAGCSAIYALEKSANEYRANQAPIEVIYGHRVGPNGQEMLVTK